MSRARDVSNEVTPHCFSLLHFQPLTLQFPELCWVEKLGHFPDLLYRCVTLLELLVQTSSISLSMLVS